MGETETMIQVRVATSEDTAEVARLLAQLGYPSQPDKVSQRIDRFQAAHRDTALVAVDGAAVVGLCSMTTIPLLAEGGAVAHLTSLVVAADARGQGVGRRLIEAAETWAMQHGCDRMQVSSGRRPEREAAHAFYTALGYEDTRSHHVLYAKNLDGDVDSQH